MAEREDYFDYVANVLGVKSFYLEPGVVSFEPAAHTPLLILVEDLSNYSPEESDLLEKMVAALKLDPSIIKITDLKNSTAVNSDFKIYFTDKGLGTGSSEANQVSTYSPRVLLKKAILKKQAWNDLQKVIQFFASPK